MAITRTLHKKQPYYLIAYRILLALLWTQYTVLSFVRVIISRIPYIGPISEVFIPICIIIALVVSIPWFARNIKGSDVLFYVGIVMLYLVTMVVFPDNKAFMSENWWNVLFLAALTYFMGVAYSHDSCFDDLFWCSAASVFFMFLYQIFKMYKGIALEDDNMFAAYNLLPSVMYLIYYAICKERKIFWFAAFASVGIIFIFGTRGPVLCVIVYLVAFLLYRTIIYRKKSSYLLLFFAFVLLIVFCIYDDLFIKIVSLVANVFERLGFSSRVFNMFLSGDATTSLGREYLKQATIEAILDNPIKGYGFTGDQHILGIYCHNILLEMWCHFGLIGGSLVLITLITLTIIALIKSSYNKKTFLFVVMLISMVYVKLMISSSYTLEPYFFFMIGVFVAINRKFIKTRVNYKKAERDIYENM